MERAQRGKVTSEEIVMTEWHKLVIDRHEGTDNAGTRECIRHFWDAYVAAGRPPGIEVWHRHTRPRENVFVFSPEAVSLALKYGPFSAHCDDMTALREPPSLEGFAKVQL